MCYFIYKKQSYFCHIPSYVNNVTVLDEYCEFDINHMSLTSNSIFTTSCRHDKVTGFTATRDVICL